MPAFAPIWDLASRRKGGDAALEALLPSPAPREEALAASDAQWLADMSRRVFAAGFSMKVVQSKWPAFEERFHGFDPGACSMLDDETLDRFASDPALIRNRARIEAVRENAAFLRRLAEAEGRPAGHVFADWPAEDYVGLLALLKAEGARLGGITGAYLLRGRGIDGFVMTPDVTAALNREGVISGAGTSKTAMRAAQAAFDAWRAETGRPMMQLSRVLALSVGD
ncbi:MAG: DNA-3-methyladenine glycosylase I [Pseudomonadota bacterium]|nr:DNA-3-methyladenine glycosylase I [Pseudomonadota bacterium]MEE3100585.1 DNA-3-methyladenine glycosylase I [Pseudomonadota bacterium]